MQNYLLRIQYDGANYAGWQIQNNAVTVQGEISNAIKTLLNEDVNLIGSGRTDSGVHAWGQAANFRCSAELDEKKFLYSLNGILKPEIFIRSIEKVDLDFHARFSAKKRSYLYLIVNNKSPFYRQYTHFVPWIQESKIEELNRISKSLIGKYDFISFAKKKAETDSTECEIYNAGWKYTGGLYLFFIEANRFLHGMVRAVTGTILFAVEKGLDEEYIKNVIIKKNRDAAAMSVPANGLFLFKVKY